MPCSSGSVDLVCCFLCLKAEWYHYTGNHQKQFIHLMKAKHYVKAHNVFCRFVGPIALSTSDNQMGRYVQEMSKAHADIDIPMWSHGGGIYMEFERYNA